MQSHKVAAQIILLILSFINFAFTAPVLVRGIREVAKDVTIASQKRWNPSDKWSTNAPDRTNTPLSSTSSDSDYRLEQELGPRDPRSPMALNPSHSSLRSRDSDNSHPSPVSSPPPAHNGLPDLNVAPQPSLSDNSHPLPVDSPPPAHNNLPFPLDIDLNATPQPSLSINSHPLSLGLSPPAHDNLPLDIDLNVTPHPLPVGSPPPAHNNLPFPLDIDLNATPHPSLSLNFHPLSLGLLPPAQPLDIDSNAAPQPSLSPPAHYHSTGSGTQSSSHHSMGSQSGADTVMMSSSEWETSVFWFPDSLRASSSASSNGNLDVGLNRLPVPTDDQLPPALPSDPRSSKRPYSPSDDSDPWPSKRPHVPSDPGPSTWAYPPSDPGPSRRPYIPSDPGPSTWAHSPSTSWPDAMSPGTAYEMWANSKSPSSSPSHDSNPPPQYGNLDKFLNRPLSGSGPTDGQPPLAAQSDPGPSRRPYSPSDSGWSSSTYPQALSDPGLSRQPFSPLDAGSPTGPQPPSNPGPLELESEEVFSQVFRGRFKRDISGSRYVNAAY